MSFLFVPIKITCKNKYTASCGKTKIYQPSMHWMFKPQTPALHYKIKPQTPALHCGLTVVVVQQGYILHVNL